MNTQTEAKPSMSRAIKRHCDDNPSIIASVSAFPTAFDAFKPKITEINNHYKSSFKPVTNGTYIATATAIGCENFQADGVGFKLGVLQVWMWS